MRSQQPCPTSNPLSASSRAASTLLLPLPAPAAPSAPRCHAALPGTAKRRHRPPRWGKDRKTKPGPSAPAAIRPRRSLCAVLAPAMRYGPGAGVRSEAQQESSTDMLRAPRSCTHRGAGVQQRAKAQAEPCMMPAPTIEHTPLVFQD